MFNLSHVFNSSVLLFPACFLPLKFALHITNTGKITFYNLKIISLFYKVKFLTSKISFLLH